MQHTLRCGLVCALALGAGRAWRVETRGIRVAGDAASPKLRLEVGLVGELSSLGVTKVWCDDLIGSSIVAGSSIEPGSRMAWCIDHPAEDLWTTDVVAAPIGLDFRLAGAGKAEWLGLGVHFSTLALQKTGLGSELSADLPAGLAPLKAMAGLDVAFPLESQRVHVVGGGGPVWTVNNVGVEIRFTYGVSFLVDLLDIVQDKASGSS